MVSGLLGTRLHLLSAILDGQAAALTLWATQADLEIKDSQRLLGAVVLDTLCLIQQHAPPDDPAIHTI